MEDPEGFRAAMRTGKPSGFKSVTFVIRTFFQKAIPIPQLNTVSRFSTGSPNGRVMPHFR